MNCYKILTLLRHGESVSNAGDLSADPETIALTARGHRQAALAAENILACPDLLVVSRMLRSRQSAEPLISRFPGIPVETWAVHEFVFLNFRHENPLTIEQRRPQVDEYWKRSDPKGQHPDAESFEEFWSRILGFHQQVLAHRAMSIAVVSHGFFMKAYTWGLAHGFPPCTKELMNTLRNESLRYPYPNSAIERIELSLAGGTALRAELPR